MPDQNAVTPQQRPDVFHPRTDPACDLAHARGMSANAWGRMALDLALGTVVGTVSLLAFGVEDEAMDAAKDSLAVLVPFAVVRAGIHTARMAYSGMGGGQEQTATPPAQGQQPPAAQGQPPAQGQQPPAAQGQRAPGAAIPS